MKIFKRIPEGGKFPKGCGVAYYDYTTNEGICCLVPFNKIIYSIRELYQTIRMGNATYLDRIKFDMYYKGKKAGKLIEQKSWRDVINSGSERDILEKVIEVKRKKS